MKSKVILFAVTVVALIVGYFAGRLHLGASWNRFFDEYTHLRESNAIASYVRALTYFRDGRQDDALMVLETDLDGALTMFVAYDRVPPAQRDKTVVRAIGAARDYRAKHPWSSSGEADQAIKKLLETVR